MKKLIITAAIFTLLTACSKTPENTPPPQQIPQLNQLSMNPMLSPMTRPLRIKPKNAKLKLLR